MDKIFVTLGGSGLIAFIWWFFFGKKDEDFKDKKPSINKSGKTYIDIVVDGGYKPATVFLQKDVKTILNIIRKDTNTCLADIVIPDFKVSKYLPLNKSINIEITPKSSGEFNFHCGMNMFHGKLVVSD